MTTREKHQYRNARLAVIDALSTQPATYRELEALTGASASTIEKVCISLRYSGHPCLANLVQLKNMPPRRSVGRDLAAVATHTPLPAVAIVALGMASRSPLERAWNGESVS